MVFSDVENLGNYHLRAYVECKSVLFTQKAVLFRPKTCFFIGCDIEAVVFDRYLLGTCGLRRIVEKNLAHRRHSF